MKLDKDFSEELSTLRKQLNAEFAIISHITGADYEVLAVNSDLDMICTGDHFETQNTYCNEVIKTQKTITYDHVGSIDDMINHPIYTTIQLEAYIGEPLHKDGKVIGTLNFSSFNKKQPGFTDEETEKVKALAKKVEAALI